MPNKIFVGGVPITVTEAGSRNVKRAGASLAGVARFCSYQGSPRFGAKPSAASTACNFACRKHAQATSRLPQALLKPSFETKQQPPWAGAVQAMLCTVRDHYQGDSPATFPG